MLLLGGSLNSHSDSHWQGDSYFRTKYKQITAFSVFLVMNGGDNIVYDCQAPLRMSSITLALEFFPVLQNVLLRIIPKHWGFVALIFIVSTQLILSENCWWKIQIPKMNNPKLSKRHLWLYVKWRNLNFNDENSGINFSSWNNLSVHRFCC